MGQPLALQANAAGNPYADQEREYEELLCLASKGNGQKCNDNELVAFGACIHACNPCADRSRRIRVVC